MPERNLGLETKEQVFGLAFGDEARTYPLSLFEGNNLINGTLASQKVVIFASASGAGVQAYKRGGHVFTFDLPNDPAELMFAMLDESDGEWRPVDNALTSLDGPVRSFTQVASRDTYWFSWGAFYPHMGIYSP